MRPYLRQITQRFPRLVASAFLIGALGCAPSLDGGGDQMEGEGEGMQPGSPDGGSDQGVPTAIELAKLSPMQVGSTFDYAFTATGCSPGSTLHMEVQSVASEGADQIYTIESVATCNSRGTPYELEPEISLQSMSEDEVRWKLESTQTWRTIMTSPVADGTSFETGLTLANAPETFQWAAVDEIEVPAGQFSNCWKTTSDVANILDERTYCPEVGLVYRSLSSVDGLTGTTIEQLVSYDI